MSYKNKHLGLKKYVPAAVMALTLATQGCKENPKLTEKHHTEQGLLDPTPEITTDKYGTKVELRPTSVPVYSKNGAPKLGYAVLTRGQDTELFEKYGKIDELSLQGVYFNQSSTPTFVMTGKYDEIVDENGKWTGLVADFSGRATPLAAENVEQYRFDFNKTFYKTYQPRRAGRQESNENTEIEQISDSVATDSLKHQTDTIQHSDSLKVRNFSLSGQMQDTIINRKGNEY